MENSRFTFTKIRMELFDFLKFNKDEKAYLFYCISRQLIRYNLKDGKDDIVQIICEGLLIEINKNANIKEYDEITKNITYRKKELMIDIKTNKKLMKIINKEYKILELKKEIRFLGRKISNITSDAYGVRSRKKSDFYNSVSDSDSSSNNLKKTRVILPEYDGDLDNNADFDIKTKYIINNYLADLDNTEKVMFEKLYYEGVSYKGMLELDEVKSDYSLRIFVKKTKKYFKEQLLD